MKGNTKFEATTLTLLAVLLAFIVIIRVPDGSVEADPAESSATPAAAGISASEQASTSSPEVSESPDPYSDKPEVDITSWELRLVNAENPLDEDYSPELTEIESGQYFDSRAEAYLELFLAAAENEGYSVYITSSYRTYATQETLYENKVNQYLASEGSREAAEEKAKTIVAYPGTSEHQLGLACDITDGYYQYMNESLADTELFKWLSAHCAEYGFILRYPSDKEDITGVMYEPWHFRYVGSAAAEYITKKGLCLEEFIALYE